jgi:hypothetical protein
MEKKAMRSSKIFVFSGLLAGFAACGNEDGGPGRLRVLLAAEDTISEGLTVGTDAEQSRDCPVTYSKYVVALGRVKMMRSEDGAARNDPAVFIADLKQLGTQSLPLATFEEVPSGQWDKFEYEHVAAAADTQPLGTVAAADLQAMRDKGLTHLIEGSAACPARNVRFTFEVVAPARFYDCESDGEPGVSVGSGGGSAATVTLHGDHLWFDSLPTGSEGTVMRRAAWLVRADADANGMLTTSDLAAVPAEVAFPSSEGYSLGGATISNALDFVKAQLVTQGHLNGEGECSWTAL